MNSCKFVHETIIRDIVDILADLKDYDEVEFELSRKDPAKGIKSIAAASSNLTLVFPVVAPSDLAIETASMACKAIERKCVTMLQMLFSAIQITNADNAFEYLAQFHKNLNLGPSMSVDNFINTMDKIATSLESVNLAKVDRRAIEAIKEDMKNLNFNLPDDVNPVSIKDYKVHSSVMPNAHNIVSYYSEGGLTPDQIDKNQRAVDYVRNKQERGTTAVTSILGKFAQNNGGGTSKAESPSRTRLNDTEYFTKQILPTDVKKANELMPTLMVINFIKASDSADSIQTTAVIGVKAKLYVVDSMDMANRLKLKVNDTNWVAKLVRASTREISFFKDFVFAIDKAKLDAFSQSRAGGSSNKLWKVLERRSLKSKIRRTLNMTNDATAITTILISQDIVEYLRKMDNIDLESVNTIRPIMESYNFMGICILDEASEIAKFIFDTGDDIFESISFTHLEREASDTTYKKVVNLMTKMK